MQIPGPGKPRFLAALVLGVVTAGACSRNDTAGQPESDVAGDPATQPEVVAEAATAPPSAPTAEPREVISETMPYADVNDALVYGYFVAPADMFEPLPAVIMLHERWGLTDDIRARAKRVAAQGYIVLAVDLFAGRTTESAAEARELMLSVLEDSGAAEENLRSAYDFVRQIGAPKVATIGWRFGGTWSLNAAMLLADDLDAAVVYYAPVTGDEDKLRSLTAPVLGLFAENDISVKTESVEAFEATLDRLGKEHEIQIFGGVRQGFASETATHYDAASADLAWNVTLDFLRRHLAAES